MTNSEIPAESMNDSSRSMTTVVSRIGSGKAALTRGQSTCRDHPVRDPGPLGDRGDAGFEEAVVLEDLSRSPQEAGSSPRRFARAGTRGRRVRICRGRLDARLADYPAAYLLILRALASVAPMINSWSRRGRPSTTSL